MESQDVLVTRACILLHPSAVCTRLVLIGVTWLQEALYVFYFILSALFGNLADICMKMQYFSAFTDAVLLRPRRP